jgi:molybdopterin-containing oxidoreductase family iron-sulfur binding subunit
LSITKELTELHNQRFVSFNTKQFQDVLLSLTGLTGTFYDYIKANAASMITGSTWNQVLHDDDLCWRSFCCYRSSADYSAAANALAKSKVHQDLSLFCIPRQVWVMVSKQITLGYKSFLINTRVSWDNYVTVSNADAKKYELLMKLLLMVD